MEESNVKMAAASLQAAPALTINCKPPTAQSILEAMVDIQEDYERNAPEHRCYADNAQRKIFEIARRFVATPKPTSAAADDARDAARSQHDADSRELRSLCIARDEARRERDLLKVDVAALEASVGHLSRLVDELRPGHDRYQYLRERPVDTIETGGVFAGLVPDNVVLNGDDLDLAVDAALSTAAAKPAEEE